MNTENIKTLSDVVDALTTKPVEIDFDIHPRSKLHRWLQKKGWLPAKKKYLMRPIVIGNLLRISRLLLSINLNSEEAKKGLSLDIGHKMVADHAETMIEIVAIAIHNQRSEPGKKLKRELKENLTAQEILHLATITLQQMNLQAFIHSIIWTSGLNVLNKKENEKELNEVSQLLTGS